MPTIRPYREGDLPALLALVRELQAHEAAIYDRMKAPEDMGAWYLDLLKKDCADKGGTILIAEDEGAIIGYATILTEVHEDGKGDEVAYCYAHVGDLVTARHVRGRGIGRLLLGECERRAKAAGRDELRITVLADNGRAHQVYRDFGFADLLVDMRKILA